MNYKHGFFKPLVYVLMSSGFIIKLYQDQRTVYSLQEIAMLIDEPDYIKLKQRVNYYVRTHKIRRLRKGIYAKQNYSVEELACKIFKPAYISLEYVLQQTGVIFQYSANINLISYLSRKIEIGKNQFVYRKIKNEILYNSAGINMNDNGINKATPERAFLDTLYLNKEYYFDSYRSLDKTTIFSLLPMYQSYQLIKRVKKLF